MVLSEDGPAIFVGESVNKIAIINNEYKLSNLPIEIANFLNSFKRKPIFNFYSRLPKRNRINIALKACYNLPIDLIPTENPRKFQIDFANNYTEAFIYYTCSPNQKVYGCIPIILRRKQK